MCSYHLETLTEEVREAVDLWRYGVPQNVDLTEVGLWFDKYDKVIGVLTNSENPYHDVVAQELRGYKQVLQERIDQHLRETGDLE